MWAGYERRVIVHLKPIEFDDENPTWVLAAGLNVWDNRGTCTSASWIDGLGLRSQLGNAGDAVHVALE